MLVMKHSQKVIKITNYDSFHHSSRTQKKSLNTLFFALQTCSVSFPSGQSFLNPLYLRERGGNNNQVKTIKRPYRECSYWEVLWKFRPKLGNHKVPPRLSPLFYLLLWDCVRALAACEVDKRRERLASDTGLFRGKKTNMPSSVMPY